MRKIEAGVLHAREAPATIFRGSVAETECITRPFVEVPRSPRQSPEVPGDFVAIPGHPPRHPPRCSPGMTVFLLTHYLSISGVSSSEKPRSPWNLHPHLCCYDTTRMPSIKKPLLSLVRRKEGNVKETKWKLGFASECGFFVARKKSTRIRVSAATDVTSWCCCWLNARSQ